MQEVNHYELMYMSRIGDERALETLITSMEGLVCDIARRFVLNRKGMEIYLEDIIQEGRCALLEAIDGYREDRSASFATYASLVIKRRVWKEIRKYTTVGRVQMHDTILLDETVGEGTWYDFLDQSDKMADPVYYTHYQLAKDTLEETLGGLTETEKRVLDAWLDEECYQAAADKLCISKKSYDGRLMRLRRKLRKSLDQS